MNKEEKEECLLKLAKKRQKDNHLFPKYGNLSEYYDGKYECDYVSPYSKSANNVNAEIMIILKDWCSEEFLLDMYPKKLEHYLDELKYDPLLYNGYDPELKTNKNLINLLDETFGIYLEDTYTTNLFPFIKKGGMSESIPVRDREYTAKNYTIKQIECIQPCLIIALGNEVFDILGKICGYTEIGSPYEPGIDKFNYDKTNSMIYFQYHPSRYFGGKKKVLKNWKKMKEYFENNC